MDERVRDHADVLVDWSARIEADDDVVVSVAEGAHDLAVAVAERLGARGANLVATYASDEVTRAYLRAHDGEFGANEHERALYEAADSVLFLGGGRNATATADVPGNRKRAYRTATAEVREVRMDTDWVSTVHPTRSLAQEAGMSYEAYADFVYDTVLRDWASLADEMAQLKELFDAGDEVRLVKEPSNERKSTDLGDSTGSPRRTDLTMSIEDRTAVNSAASVAYDSHNLPSGEVFTAPADAAGEVCFDVPMTVDGHRLRDVSLRFEGGEVVDYDAAKNAGVLGDVLDTDAGARRLGELGVGMNRGIDRFTDSILFDEKMGGTVHLAVGRAYDACLPDDEAGNESAVHIDLITDMTAGGSRLEVDGDVVQRDGVFRWEDGFED